MTILLRGKRPQPKPRWMEYNLQVMGLFNKLKAATNSQSWSTLEILAINGQERLPVFDPDNPQVLQVWQMFCMCWNQLIDGVPVLKRSSNGSIFTATEQAQLKSIAQACGMPFSFDAAGKMVLKSGA